MPISYRIDSDKNLVSVVGYRVLTDEDLLEFRKELVNDPLFRPDMMELADYRFVEFEELETEGLQRFIEQERLYLSTLGDYRIAIVTSSNLHYGLSRMYTALIKDVLPNVEVFRDMDEAKAWLFGDSDEVEDDR